MKKIKSLFLLIILIFSSFSTISFSDNAWINMDWECLKDWQCWMNVYELLGIRDWETANPEWFIWDIITWATMFIWVVVTASLVVSGFLFVLAWADEKMAEKWKSWMKYSFIGLLLVIFSYTIIRALQFLAAW